MSQAHAETEPAIRRRLTQGSIAALLYEGMRDLTDPSWHELSEAEKAEFLHEARGALRETDPLAREVAEEMAAQAYATDHGWDWPQLQGYATAPSAEAAFRAGFLAGVTCADGLYTVDEAWKEYRLKPRDNKELVLLEARQKIRHWARVMCRAYMRHLQEGGIDGPSHMSFEESFHAMVTRQNLDDAERRLVLKPKPVLHVVTRQEGAEP